MKKIKFIFIFFLMLLSFIFSGEFFQYYLNTYTSQFSYIDITENEMNSQAEIQNNIYHLAEKYNIEVLQTERKNGSGRATSLTVYSTDEAFEKLKTEYSVSPNIYKALFLGTTKVDFADFKDKKLLGETERYYFIGEQRQIQSIRENIKNDYACSFIKNETEHAYPYLVLLIWAVVGVLFLILTWLDIHFQKKENFVLVSLGKPIRQIILKNVFIDFLTFSLIFSVLFALLGRFVYLGYEIKNIVLLCAAVLFLNALLYLTLFKMNYKEVLYGANLNERIISDGYVLKSISMILTVVVLSCNAMLISANFKELKRIKTLRNVENYSFLELNPVSLLNLGKDYEETRYGLINSIYGELQNRGCAYSFCGLSGENDYCIINSDSKFLLNGFDLKTEPDGNSDFYILVPEEIEFSQNADESVYDCIEMYFGSEKALSCEKITYSGNGELLTYDSTEGLTLGAQSFENPIVIYINNPSLKLNCDSSTLSTLFSKMLFNISNSEINTVCEKYQINEKGFYLQGEKVKEKVSDYQAVLNRALLLNTVISAFLLLLELFIISVIIKLEYKVSTTELAVKKVLGYSVFQKNKQIFLLNTYAALIAVVSCTVFCLMYKLAVWYTVIAVGTLVLCFEYVIIAVLITRFEKQNVAKILKGGCL